jgi:phage shock protein B
VSQGLSEHEHRQLTELANKAEKMAERVNTLESILDAQSPEWRAKYE